VVDEEAVSVSVAIRVGSPHEGARLKEIAIASKGHWGYGPDRVRRWADEGDFAPARLRQLTVLVAEVESRAIGWSSLESKGETCWLGDLWIEPDWIGKGIGRALFLRSAEHARALGAKWLEWEAEPNALGFYEKMGGRYLREAEPSSWGRRNAIMGVELDA